MLTPQEVAEHGFSKAHVGGYNMKEVDDFLDQVTEDYGQLYKECAVLKGKIKFLAEKISEYRETEEAMRSTLLSAQKMAKSMVAEAEEEKKRKIADAEKLALQRKVELEREVTETEGKLAAAQASTQQFINQVRELVRREEAFLDKLPTMKVTAAEETAPKAAEQKPEEAAETAEPAAEAAGDSIDQILQEEQEPQLDQPAEVERELVGVAAGPEAETAVELGDISTSRIDFDNLKFGKDYEIE